MFEILDRFLEDKGLEKNLQNSIQQRSVLTAGYKKSAAPPFQGDLQRLVYLATRMPATYAVCLQVLKETFGLLGDIQAKTLLDVGSGPGTAMWAAREVVPALDSFVAIERDAAMAQLGQELMGAASYFDSVKVQWDIGALAPKNIPVSDVIIASYSLSELPAPLDVSILEKLWQQAQEVLIIIEPGTPAHYSKLMRWRDQLLDWGAFIVAPCPHRCQCPLQRQKEEWCHFAARLQRSRLHRQLKEGSLGYEDEKYCYLALSKKPFSAPYKGRVIASPMKRSGHFHLTLCNAEGNKTDHTISRRQKTEFDAARDLTWGSAFF